MWPMWTCICTFRSFEETYDNTLWRPMEQMQSMWLYISSGTWKPTLDKNCDYASVGAGDLTEHLKMCTLEKNFTSATNGTNAINVTMYQFWLMIWGHKWKPMLEKNCSNVTLEFSRVTIVFTCIYFLFVWVPSRLASPIFFLWLLCFRFVDL